MNQTVIDYTYIQNTVWKIKSLYPTVKVCQIGKSVVGRSIYSLELGRATAPAVLFLGTFTGRDTTTGELLLTWFSKVAKAVSKKEKIDGVSAQELVRKNRIVVVPFVNPDGREICERGPHCAGVDSGRIRRLSGGHTAHWDANARGVDITQNFDFRFATRQKNQQNKGVYSPGAKGYPGTGAESEPETVAITGYCRSHPVHQAVCLYPGKGQIFWRTPGIANSMMEKQANIMGVMADYEVEASFGCAVDTGFRNWFTASFGKPAFDVMVNNNLEQGEYMRLQELLTLSCLF